MSNHENEIQFESYLNDIKETLDNPSDELRGKNISEGLGNMRSRIGKLDIQVNTNFEKEVKEVKPHYEGTELADVALNVYRTNIQEEKPEKETINSKAARENTRATIRSLMGLRSSGDEGKRAPNANMSGSGSTGGMGPANVVIPPLSMEDYRAQVFKDFGLIEEEASFESIQEEVVEEELDLVSELETNLLELNDRSWIEADRTTRQLCQEHGVLVKDLNKEFKSRHGVFPDKWIKEQVEVEQCGWIPLDEMKRISKIGKVYDVTFMYRGGTQRFKFFWPSPSLPTRDDMQQAVEKFYPKARLIAFYPSSDNDDNYMVVVPPMSENYEIIPESNWEEISEDVNETFHMICENEGEPTSPIFMEEDGSFTFTIEDHDTGEEREVMIEGSGTLHSWFSKSKSKDGKPGWVQSDGSPCANEPGETKTPKCYSSQRLAGLKRTPEGRKKIRSADARKSRQDKGQQQKSGAAKPTMVRTFTDKKDYKKHSSGDTKTRDESFDPSLDEACWKGYEKKGMKTMFGKKYPNCVKKEEIEIQEDMKGMSQKSGDKRSTESGAGMTAQGVAKYNRRTGGNLKTAVTTPPSKLKPGSKAAKRRKSFCARSKSWTGERGKAARRRWNC